jgi:hypothetical protein
LLVAAAAAAAAAVGVNEGGGWRRLVESHRLSRGAGGYGDDLKGESCCVGWGGRQCASACEVHAFFNFVVVWDDAGIINTGITESGNQ